MLQQLVLIVIALLYLQKKSVSSLTYEHVAFLLLLAYLMRQSFRVENLSAADGFTTDIDKEAYTNLHKIVSELYKNDTLTIPGHVHIQGNLQVGSRGDIKGAPRGDGVIYTDWVKGRVLASNEKIDKDRIDIRSDTYFDVHANMIGHRQIHVKGASKLEGDIDIKNNDIYCRSVHSSGEVHTNKVRADELEQRFKGWVFHKSNTKFEAEVRNKNNGKM